MFQPDFNNPSNSNPSSRLRRLAFVVGDPAEGRASTMRSDCDNPRPDTVDEENKWLHERLTACYND